MWLEVRGAAALISVTLLLGLANAACPKFSEWSDATVDAGGPLVCAKIYSNDNCSGLPTLLGVGAAIPDLEHTLNILVGVEAAAWRTTGLSADY